MLLTLDLCFAYFDLEMKVADINFSRSAPHPKSPSHLILEVCHTHFSRTWESQQQFQLQKQDSGKEGVSWSTFPVLPDVQEAEKQWRCLKRDFLNSS